MTGYTRADFERDMAMVRTLVRKLQSHANMTDTEKRVIAYVTGLRTELHEQRVRANEAEQGMRVLEAENERLRCEFATDEGLVPEYRHATANNVNEDGGVDR